MNVLFANKSIFRIKPDHLGQAHSNTLLGFAPNFADDFRNYYPDNILDKAIDGIYLLINV